MQIYIFGLFKILFFLKIFCFVFFDGEAKGKKKTQTWTPNTHALAQTTLEITIGCLCRGPCKRFQGPCRFSTNEKLVQRLDSFVRVSRLVERDHKQTRARELVHDKRCSKWPPLARTHDKHL